MLRKLSNTTGQALNDIRKEAGAHSDLYGTRPLYFTSAAEPLLIETPIERKISRSRSEKMASVADINPKSISNQQTMKTTNDDKNISNWSSSTEEREPENENAQQQIGIWQSIRSYPKGVFFMLSNEFCERFSFYGMRAILIIYLTTDHHLSENVAKEIYHSFVSLAYFSPLFGSILADNYFGRFHVILWVSLFYVFGHLLLSIGAIPFLDEIIKRTLDYSGLAVIAIATGGIKPCVSAFAADQFNDDQHRERTQFFSFFYFSINAGSLIAIALTPLLRTVQCFNSEHCFPLAFGVPGVLMLFAFLTFLAGWRFYKISPASKGNIIWKVVKCIVYAFRLKLKSKFAQRRTSDAVAHTHWLDYALSKYDAHLIAGVKSLLAVVLLYIPVVFFWALFDQQGSTWVLQARRMDGRVGWFTILPDQMNVFNPLMILILVPLFEALIYPLCNRVFKVTPLRKMAVGGILAAVAFCIAGFLQIKVNDTMEPKPKSGHTFIYRLGNSSAEFIANNQTDIIIPVGNSKYEIIAGNYTFIQNNGDVSNNFSLPLATDPPTSYVVGLFNLGNRLDISKFPYTCEKTGGGKTRFYFLLPDSSYLNGMEAFALDNDGKKVANATIKNGNVIDIQPGFFSYSPNYKIGIKCDNENPEKPVCQYYHYVHVEMGAAFILDLTEATNKSNGTSLTQLVRPNSVSILWQLPQVFVITVGEILFSVTGLEFSYSQAAPSMKSVLQALWLLTVFFGNVVDIIISHMEIADPVLEFFVYAAMMFAVIGIFIFLAMRYQYVDEHNLEIPDSHTSSEDKEKSPKHFVYPSQKMNED